MLDLLEKIKKYLTIKPLFISWLIVAGIIVFLFFVFTFIVQPILREATGVWVAARQYDTADNVNNRIQLFLNENLRMLDGLSGILSSGAVSEDASKELLPIFLEKCSEIKEISLAGNNGQEIIKISQPPLKVSENLLNIGSEENFLEAMAGKIYFGSVDTTNKTAPSLSVSMSFASSTGGTGGVLSEKLSLSQIRDIILNVDTGEGGQAYLTDSEGNIIIHRDKSFIGKNILDRAWVREVIKNKKLFNGPIEETTYTSDQGTAMRVVGLPLKQSGWGVFVEMPIKEIWGSYNTLRWFELILSSVIILLLYIVLFNGRRLSKAFLEVADSRQRLEVEYDSHGKKLQEIRKMTKLLVRRDLELNMVNHALDQKIVELGKALAEMKIARNEAEEEKEKTMALFSSFSTPVLFFDNYDKLALFNPAAQKILGINDQDLGKKVSSENNFSLNNFNNIIHNKFSVEKIKDEHNIQLEEVNLGSGNEIKVFKVFTVKVEETGKDIFGTMKIFYDTTREKTIDRLKSEFISIVAHQLRTPLSAIKWVIKMILDGDAGKLNVEQQELLGKGYASNERIIRLINDLLNVSRVEEGKFGFEFNKTDFQEVLDAAVDNVEGLIKKSHQQLTVKKPANLPPVCLDKEKMIIALQNLLGNATKYTPEYGKVEVKIEVDKQNLHVKIKDQGVGIPQADQPKIFTKFFRAANAVKLETEGTGLGLFMVKNIINKHNGQISLKSEEGKGTEVSFSIPLEHN